MAADDEETLETLLAVGKYNVFYRREIKTQMPGLDLFNNNDTTPFSYVSLCLEGSCSVTIYLRSHAYERVVWDVYICIYNIRSTLIKMGRQNTVRIASRYGLDGPGIESLWGRGFPHPSRPVMGPTQPPTQWVPGLSRWYSGRAVKLTTQPHIVPRLKKE